MNTMLIVAVKEFRDAVRNRWAFSLTLVFALLALGIAYFGASASGVVGFTSLATTLVSLASLAIFLIPLIALLLAYDSIVGEEEQGTLLLLLAYPITRTQLLAGKFLGHAAVLALSIALGFGIAALLIGWLTNELGERELWQAFGIFIVSAILLGWSFVAIAYVASAWAREKSQAAGGALLVWFWFVLIFDLILLGLLVISSDSTNNAWLSYLLFLNPADLFRVVNLAGFEAVRSYTGLGTLATGALFQPSILIASLLVWVILPLAAAAWLFNRRRI